MLAAGAKSLAVSHKRFGTLVNTEETTLVSSLYVIMRNNNMFLKQSLNLHKQNMYICDKNKQEAKPIITPFVTIMKHSKSKHF